MAADSPFLASANTNTTTQGSIWAVLVQPSFPDLIFEASALLTKSVQGGTTTTSTTTGGGGGKMNYQPSEYAIQIKERAQSLIQTPEKDENDEEVEEVKESETEELREQKRKIVEEVWTKVQPQCFTKSDDRELEATTNLLITLLLSFFTPTHDKFRTMVHQLIGAISTAEGKTTSYGRYTALFTLFNALPAPSSNSPNETPLQLMILSKLTEMGSSHLEDLNLLLPSFLRLPSYLTQWSLISSPVSIELVEGVIGVLQRGSKPIDAFNLAIRYLSSPHLAQDDDIRGSGKLEQIIESTIQLALSLPDCYDWDMIDEILPISEYVQSHPIGSVRYGKLFKLLKSTDVGYRAIEEELRSNDQLVKVIQDPTIRSRIEQKARLLTLTDLCNGRVGGQVSYGEVQACLGLESSSEEDDDGMEVEEWVINAVKAKLISARLHQPSKVIYVTKSSSRSFGEPQWKTLESKLRAWGDSIDQLIGIVGQSMSSNPATIGDANKGSMLTASA